ncbi:hypothetical protein BKA70DRAFT_1443491 [Coprinopsis sp. MPI-PUGE-AT-0042]|nr:hypothetical protein BKA70DRAFT_1443491 [Coprinopsis sp. MPI-PUGE-AT-0042]
MKKWTDEYENSLEFLAGLIPEYLEAQETKKRLKDGFYPDVKERFKAKFHVAPTDAEIQKLGKEQATEMVDKKLLNVSRGESSPGQEDKGTDLPGGRRSHQKYSRSCIKIMPAQRALQSIHAYQVLYYKDEVKEAQLAAREEYVKQCEKEGTAPSHAFAFRNQWLRERFPSESEEVKAKVEEYRLLSTKPCVANETIEERNSRYARNIAKVPKTLEGIGQSLANETGWFASMTIGGPHPAYGGKLVTFSRHFGKTGDGKTYEEFIGAEEFARQLALFDDFLLAAFDESDRKDRVCDAKEGPVVYDDVNMQSEDEDEDEADDAEHSTSSRKENADDKPKRSAIAQLSEYELEKEKNIARNKALLEEHGLAGGASKLLKATGSRKNDAKSSDKNKKSGSSGLATTKGSKDESLKEVEKQDCLGLPALLRQTCRHQAVFNHHRRFLNLSRLSLRQLSRGGHISTTGSEGKEPGDSQQPAPSALFPESVPGGLPLATGNHGRDAGECQRPDPKDTDMSGPGSTTSDVAVANTVAPSNGTVFGEGEVAGVKPSSSLSVPAHVASLWDYLLGLDTRSPWQDLLQAFLVFESCSPLHSSMPTTMRPTEVGSWMKRHRKAGTPKEIDATEFGPCLVAWWRSLQPDKHIQSSASPASYKRDGLEDGIWEKLRKGGPNGLGLVVVALGWWVSAYSNESEPPASLLELLEDVTWVLGQLSTSTTGGEATQDVPRGKRKAGGGGGSRSKRHRGT